MQAIDVSIVIVNYNVKDFLYQCLLSIRASSKNLKVETIVVDNNSTDNSLPELIPIFPEVNFIPLDNNIGFGKANNFGFEIATGRYILILNPDTLIQEDTLDKMFEYMERSPEVGIAGCKVLNADGSFQLPCRRGFPTPWAAFCKLFGLQNLFPKSKLFARYNQTFRDENESYYIDAIIGAFMFARAELVKELEGFDKDFFMYGEDLDLCFRTYKAGYKVAYYHETQIIHYKGESSKRSSINDIKHFYEAMEIFAKKHIANSGLYLVFLRAGIRFRALIEIIRRFGDDVLYIFTDSLIAIASLLIATKLRFGGYFNFPDYAYPTVFIGLLLAIFVSLFSLGEYFEKSKSIKRSFQGLMLSFFILSSLTYYFKEFAFSRGVLLMTIGFSAVGFTATRIVKQIYSRYISEKSNKNIAIIGVSENTEKLVESLRSKEASSANIKGIIAVSIISESHIYNLPILGSINHLNAIIKENEIREIIINDATISNNDLLKIISNCKDSGVKFHIVKEFDEVIASRALNDISNIDATAPIYNITKYRTRFLKRAIDICVSLFSLTIGLPFLYLLFIFKDKKVFRKALNLLLGKISLVGVLSAPNRKYDFGKPGIFGLAHISSPEKLNESAIDKLNDYYLQRCSFSLDVDIILKQLFRK
jgi:GT2 family glycosyltransferase